MPLMLAPTFWQPKQTAQACRACVWTVCLRIDQLFDMEEMKMNLQLTVIEWFHESMFPSGGRSVVYTASMTLAVWYCCHATTIAVRMIL